MPSATKDFTPILPPIDLDNDVDEPAVNLVVSSKDNANYGINLAALKKKTAPTLSPNGKKQQLVLLGRLESQLVTGSSGMKEIRVNEAGSILGLWLKVLMTEDVDALIGRVKDIGEVARLSKLYSTPSGLKLITPLLMEYISTRPAKAKTVLLYSTKYSICPQLTQKCLASFDYSTFEVSSITLDQAKDLGVEVLWTIMTRKERCLKRLRESESQSKWEEEKKRIGAPSSLSSSSQATSAPTAAALTEIPLSSAPVNRTVSSPLTFSCTSAIEIMDDDSPWPITELASFLYTTSFLSLPIQYIPSTAPSSLVTERSGKKPEESVPNALVLRSATGSDEITKHVVQPTPTTKDIQIKNSEDSFHPPPVAPVVQNDTAFFEAPSDDSPASNPESARGMLVQEKGSAMSTPSEREFPRSTFARSALFDRVEEVVDEEVVDDLNGNHMTDGVKNSVAESKDCITKQSDVEVVQMVNETMAEGVQAASRLAALASPQASVVPRTTTAIVAEPPPATVPKSPAVVCSSASSLAIVPTTPAAVLGSPSAAQQPSLFFGSNRGIALPIPSPITSNTSSKDSIKYSYPLSSTLRFHKKTNLTHDSVTSNPSPSARLMKWQKIKVPREIEQFPVVGTASGEKNKVKLGKFEEAVSKTTGAVTTSQGPILTTESSAEALWATGIEEVRMSVDIETEPEKKTAPVLFALVGASSGGKKRIIPLNEDEEKKKKKAKVGAVGETEGEEKVGSS